MVALYYAAFFLSQLANVYAQQKYGRTSKGYSDIFVYSFFTGIIAMAFFFILSGFSIVLNLRTCIYAIIFAVVVICGSFTRLPAYKFMGVAESGVLVSSMTIVLTALTGFVFFREELTLVSVARIVLMLAAVSVIFFENKKGIKIFGRSTRDTTIGFLLCIGCALVGTSSTVMSKLFAMDSGVTDTNSYFFLTNAVIFVFDACALLLIHRGSIKGTFTGFKRIAPSGYAMIGLSTVASNIGSILGVLILAADSGQGNVSLYAPLSSAIGLISSGIVGFVAAHEKPSMLAMLLSVIALFLGVFN